MTPQSSKYCQSINQLLYSALVKNVRLLLMSDTCSHRITSTALNFLPHDDNPQPLYWSKTNNKTKDDDDCAIHFYFFCSNCMSRDFSLCRWWEKLEGSIYEITTEQYWAWRRFRIYTHAAWPLRMCISVYFCLSCVTVHIYIVPLTIICMHNLKGKYVRFLFDTFITALFYYPKCYLTFFFILKCFFVTRLCLIWLSCLHCIWKASFYKIISILGGNVQS